jgi:hypothetical protein
VKEEATVQQFVSSCSGLAGDRGHPKPELCIGRYRYYIDDRDQESKATPALALHLSRLDFARQQPAAPLLTLPVGR